MKDNTQNLIYRLKVNKPDNVHTHIHASKATNLLLVYISF